MADGASGSESIADVLKRKFPDISEETRGKIMKDLDDAGIVEARLLKRVKRQHVKNHMTEFLLDFVTQKGLFLTAQETQCMADAQKLMEEGILKQTDVELEKIQVFEGVNWPSLNDIPGRIVTATGRKLWFFGRTAFESLHKQFLEKPKGVMEFDGIVGGGKTYLQVMLACRCFHDFQGTNKRLVCLFTMPRLADVLFFELRKALVLAFWDVARVQRTVLAAENIDELKATVAALKASYELYFIFDEWNVLDDRAKDSGLQKIWETLSTMERSSRSLHGGSARSDAAVTRSDKTSVDESYKGRLSDAELGQFLRKENLPKHHLLLRYTGFLPLYVRVFLTCQKATQNDEELVASFLKSHEVNAMHVGFTRMVMDTGTDNVKLDLYAHLLSQAAPTDECKFIGDQRWVLVSEDGHLGLFSEYARAAFMQRLETKLGTKDMMDGIIDNLAGQIKDECAQQVPNKSLIGWMVERIVVHIAKRWAIGEPGLDDKAVKRVHYFDFMPKCSTEHLTACIPLDWFFPYTDFLLRYEVVTRDDKIGNSTRASRNTDEKPKTRLHVNAYKVSLFLAKGDPHWDKPVNFLDTRFIGRFGMDEVDWVYTFIGRSKHKVADGRVDGKYLRQFVTFQELATSFGASLSYNIRAALQAVDKL